jgi:tetratricopeptide (TPR) repeat protein
LSSYQPDGRSRAARRKADEARRYAIAGRWEEAVTTNRQILEAFPRDTDALNRLGKALLELGQLEGSLEAFREAIGIEPSNIIAQRNINRLEQILGARQSDDTVIAPARENTVMQANVFVEEVGKTYVTDLVRPSDDMIVHQVSPADEVQLRVSGHSVEVYDQHGERLGQLEP